MFCIVDGQKKKWSVTAAALRSCRRAFLPFSASLCHHMCVRGPSPAARSNLAPCFGVDELVAQWNKPVCLLHKPVFQAYMLWRLYTAFQKKKKKKVISAAVWIRKRAAKSRADNTDPL